MASSSTTSLEPRRRHTVPAEPRLASARPLLSSGDQIRKLGGSDNSAAERALRAVSIGRKNYLFFGADSGGERAASFYTLIGTAKLNRLDPSLYLRTVLERIAEHPINRISELLPWNLAATLQSDSAEAA